MITNTATVLAAGTSVARPRFIADEIGDSDPTVGTSCCGRESRRGVYRRCRCRICSGPSCRSNWWRCGGTRASAHARPRRT